MKVDQIDHVEIFVPDRYQAASWYREVLGLEILEDYEHWAEDPRGPLMISCDGGDTKVALFTGEPQGDHPLAGLRLLAFRVDAEGMTAFIEQARRHGVRDANGHPMSADSIVDHDQAFSVYFSDPHGNRLEVTTYDHRELRKLLDERG
jgi:catechol 2,3-dioxygenase-like lactoylglutathione lyase family enzyme